MTTPPMTGIAEPVRQLLAADRSSAVLGIEVVSAEAGRAVAVMTVTPDRANGHGIAHGGLVFTLADTAFACAATSRAPGSATAAASIVYLGPAHVGEELTAEAQVRHAGDRQSLIDVTVRCGERVVAEYRGRSARLRSAAGH
jgi:acyl-CoA thioesterase